jgi:transposase-like protein
VKAGFNHGRQRFKCKDCGRQFTQTQDGNAAKRAEALFLYLLGLSMNAIAMRFKVEPSTVLYWVRNFALRIFEKPLHEGSVPLESDEMWHFIESAKRNAGFRRHIAAVPVNSSTVSAETEAARH